MLQKCSGRIQYMSKFDYENKLQDMKPGTGFSRLQEFDQKFIELLAHSWRLTFQEFRQIVEMQRDLNMWQEISLKDILVECNGDMTEATAINNLEKRRLLKALTTRYNEISSRTKSYGDVPLKRPKKREKSKIVQIQSDKEIAGMCPVASPRTVCCNLRTIDAVENCTFGCSYCTIQTFYKSEIRFDKDFAEKLKRIKLDPDRTYHFGTGQSSDSLAWGNRFDNLTALFDFAQKNPNVLLEFKTKSANIDFFLKTKAPENIVCTWSLNPEVIIKNEEHFTAGLEARLQAARQVADVGIKTGFHFHPMVWYETWAEDYAAIAHNLMSRFEPDEVLYISMGSITFIKPVMKKIRDLGFPTKILQMPFEKDPHGKWTYPDAIKTEMFSELFQAFKPWQDTVFFYLCMEKAAIWESVFGRAYSSNEIFEREFAKSYWSKISPAPKNISVTGQADY